MYRHREKYGVKNTQEVRYTAEDILKVRMDEGDTRVEEQAEGLCTVLGLSCGQARKHNLGICLLRETSEIALSDC